VYCSNISIKDILLYSKFSKSLKNFKSLFQSVVLRILQKTNLNKKKIAFEQFFIVSNVVICVNCVLEYLKAYYVAAVICQKSY